MIWFRLSIFFQMFGIGCSALIPLYWTQTLKIPDASVGFMTACGVGVSLVSPILFGRLTTRFRVERLIAGSFIVYSMSALGLLFAKGIIAQTASYAVLQFCQWGFLTLGPVAVMHSVEDSVGLEYGRYRRVGSLGYLIGSLMIGFVSDHFGNGAIFPCLAATMLCAALPYILNIRVSLHEVEPPHLRTLFSDRVLILFLLGVLFSATFFNPTFVYLPLRISEMGGSNAFTSFVISLCGLAAMLTLAGAGRFSDRYETALLLFIVPVFATIRLLCLHLPSTSYLWFPLLQVLHIPTWVLFDVLIVKFMKERAGPGHLADYQALIHIFTSAGTALGASVAGMLTREFGLRDMFLYIAVLPLGAIFFFARMRVLLRSPNQARR